MHVYFNPSAQSKVVPSGVPTEFVHAFHRKLPGYAPTRLVSLDGLAKELCVDAVYLKEESNRIGVPSFKILGASWGTFRAVARKLKLPLDCELAEVKEAAKLNPTTLYAATAGNHGRAVARVGRLLELLVEIFVPIGMHPDTMRFITDEGAHLTIVSGNYDDAVRTACEESQKSGAILVQDMAWEGYEEIPNRIVEGYSTMLREADTQLPSCPPYADPCPHPVGVGSLAQAVVTHYASPTRPSRPTIIAVEPETAACLHNALTTGTSTAIETQPTILAGLNCGTVSHTAWPSSAPLSLLPSLYLTTTRTSHAPTFPPKTSTPACGGATIAALRRLAFSSAERHAAGLNERSVLVLLCTEGARAYYYPTQLTNLLNEPDENSKGGKGETHAGVVLSDKLLHRGR
ncbi:putative diaminopropionate ammonia-lyase [Mycena leptocephala]|nr:putative diaminopropionate ammonia-lyase [Mycena leptocephala]